MHRSGSMVCSAIPFAQPFFLSAAPMVPLPDSASAAMRHPLAWRCAMQKRVLRRGLASMRCFGASASSKGRGRKADPWVPSGTLNLNSTRKGLQVDLEAP
jgi:hypothetical protein